MEDFKNYEINKNVINWLHFTDNPNLILTPIEIKSCVFKPSGLWLSMNTAWIDWCIEAEFFTFNPSEFYVHEFTILENAKVLNIESIEDLQNFINENYIQYDNSQYNIDWESASQKYDMISFLNYKKMKTEIRRKKYLVLDVAEFGEVYLSPLLSWYLAIDCDSACVFNIDILQMNPRKNTSYYSY